MSSQPLVSVCVPSYNGAEFIGQTLQSVLDQSFADFELLVVDDLSSDDTVSIVRRFTDPRIKLIRNQSNLGLGGNWNHALSLKLGKYVKLLCEDDLLHPSCLARQVRVLESPGNEGVVLAICNREVINHRNEVVLKKRSPIAPGVVCGRELVRKSIRRGTNIIGEPAVGLFRGDALIKEEVCDPTNPFLSDLGLWAELLRHGDAFFDQEYLASFRISKQATSARIGLRQAAYFRAFGSKLRSDSFYRIGMRDLMLGYLLSFPLCLLRNAFVKIRTRTWGESSSIGGLSHRRQSGSPIASLPENSRENFQSERQCRAAGNRSWITCS
jgi:glycosyltransferase involved in cell wall biosynthesis